MIDGSNPVSDRLRYGQLPSWLDSREERKIRKLRLSAARLTREELQDGVLDTGHGVSLETRRAVATSLTNYYTAEMAIRGLSLASTQRLLYAQFVVVAVLILALFSRLPAPFPEMWKLEVSGCFAVVGPLFLGTLLIAATNVVGKFAAIPYRIVILSGILCLAITAFGILKYDSWNAALAVAMGATAGLATWIVAVAARRITGWILFDRPEKNWLRTYPITSVVVSLGYALDAILTTWDIQSRCLAMEHLEDAASELAEVVPQHLGLSEEMDTVATRRFNMAAAHLVSIRGQIATPKADTRAQVASDLDDLIGIIARGDFDELPLTDDEYRKESGNQRSWGSRLLRTFVAVAPLLFLLVIQWVGVDLGVAAGYLVLVSVLWVAAGLLTTWRPGWSSELADSVAVARDIRGK